LDDVAGQQRTFAAGTARPVQHRAALEVTAAPDEYETLGQCLGLPFPKHDGLVGTHDPLAVSGVEVDRHATESLATLDHRRVGYIVYSD
jgi:hypothetical protein